MKPSKRRVNHDARDTILLGLVGTVGFLLLTYFLPVLVSYPSELALPLLMRFRPQPKISGNVVIAAIDNQTVSRMGRPPWTARQYADLISALGEYGARVVGLDVRLQKGYRVPANFQAPLKTPDTLQRAAGQEVSSDLPEDETLLIEALKRQRGTYLEYLVAWSIDRPIPFNDPAAVDVFGDTKLMEAVGAVTYKVLLRPSTRHVAYAILRGPSAAEAILPIKYYLGPSAALGRAALGSTIVDAGGSGGVMAFDRIGGTYYAPLDVALVSRYLGNAPITLTRSGLWVDQVAVGNTVIPVSHDGFMWVNLRPPDAIPRFSVSYIIARKVKASDLKDKIVLVGETIDPSIPTYAGPCSSVEIHASAVEDILSGQMLREKPSWEIVAELLLLMPVLYALFAWSVTRPKAAAFWTFTLAFLASGVFVASDIFSLTFRDIAFSSAALGGGGLLVYSGAAFVVINRRRRERNRFRSAFEHYLDPKIIDAVMANPAGLELGGEKRHLTILFADIVDFTTKAEALGPEALVETLNAFMSAMTEVVIKNGGVVDKIVGDSIMAFWGAPARVENPARMAIDCGLEMLDQLKRLRERDSRFADFEMGVGIATGEAVVGNLGGEARFDYSVVGDIVNLAARLESLTRQLKVPLLVNEQSYLEAGGQYVARDLGLIRVKGKTQPAAIWEIVGRESEVMDHSYYTSFSEALGAARETRRAAALEQLQQLAELKPGDVAVNLYLTLIVSREDLELEDLVLEFGTK